MVLGVLTLTVGKQVSIFYLTPGDVRNIHGSEDLQLVTCVVSLERRRCFKYKINSPPSIIYSSTIPSSTFHGSSSLISSLPATLQDPGPIIEFSHRSLWHTSSTVFSVTLPLLLLPGRLQTWTLSVPSPLSFTFRTPSSTVPRSSSDSTTPPWTLYPLPSLHTHRPRVTATATLPQDPSTRRLLQNTSEYGIPGRPTTSTSIR